MRTRLTALLALLVLWCVQPARAAIFQNHWTTSANPLVRTNDISTNGASTSRFLGFDGLSIGWFTPTSVATNNSIYVDGALTASPNLDTETNILWTIRDSTNLVGVLTNISGSQILSGAISNAHVSSAAAISYSKLNLSGSLVFADFGTFLNTNVALLTGTNIFSGTNTFNVIPIVPDNSFALGTKTTGNYAAGDAEAGAALTGDSATAFFSAGTIEAARLGSGSGGATKFLREDSSWQTVAGSGDMVKASSNLVTGSVTYQIVAAQVVGVTNVVIDSNTNIVFHNITTNFALVFTNWSNNTGEKKIIITEDSTGGHAPAVEADVLWENSPSTTHAAIPSFPTNAGVSYTLTAYRRNGTNWIRGPSTVALSAATNSALFGTGTGLDPAFRLMVGEDITGGTVADARIPSTITRDTELSGMVNSGGSLTTDNAILRADGTSGTNAQSSALIVDDNGAFTTAVVMTNTPVYFTESGAAADKSTWRMIADADGFFRFQNADDARSLFLDIFTVWDSGGDSQPEFWDDLIINNGTTSGGGLSLREDDSNGTNHVTFRAPATLTGNRVLDLPDANGLVAVSATAPVTLSAAGAVGVTQSGTGAVVGTSGATSTNLTLSGATVTTNFTSNTETLSPTGGTNFVADFLSARTAIIIATNDVFFLNSTNRTADTTTERSKKVRILGSGGNRLLTLQSSWLKAGTTTSTFTITNGTWHLIALDNSGPSETNVFAASVHAQ